MRLFLARIRQYRNSFNGLLITRNSILAVSFYLLTINLFFVFYVLGLRHLDTLFLVGMALKIFLGLMLLYFVLQTNSQLLTDLQAARLLDRGNDDKNDTFQNAYELYYKSSERDKDVLELIYQSADNAAKQKPVKPDKTEFKQSLFPLLITLLIALTFYVLNPELYLSSYKFFSSSKKPTIEYRDFIEVKPGNLAIPRNTSFTIEVVDPEPEVTHTLYINYGEHWRSETLYQNKKLFPNPDLSFRYFISNPYAVSDTFQVDVYEEPAVRSLSLKYQYPSYTGLAEEKIEKSNGSIRGIENTKVTIEIESNNPLQEATIFFSDGAVKQMQRLGKNTFVADFLLSSSGTYHFQLTDFLGNVSQKIERQITVIKDKIPEIKIVYPGRDTLFTQNMMQGLIIFATDDFGLQNLSLFYQINDNEVLNKELRKGFIGTTLDFDYLLDLSTTYMLPGDRVLYWAEIFDNAPTPQKGVSRHYYLRFPSIEEIFAEIEQEETQKIATMQSSLEQSQELQKDFEEKRREMMKKEKYDWEDKKELESYLDRQEELNKNIEKVTEEYQNLLEKFADNPSLSEETLEKMQRLKELMEEITDDKLLHAMEQMRQKMEQMDREDLLEAMKNFKFSMEDFEKRLQNTLDLLESIKKEQNIQKALAIAKEMEQLQEALNEKTEQKGADGEKLSNEQDKIREKLDSLKRQLEETASLLNDAKDKQSLEMLKELQQMMDEDNLAQDLSESSSALKSNQMKQASKKQKDALQKMKKMNQKLSEISQSMQQGGMEEVSEIIEHSIRRLIALTEVHQATAKKYVNDPFQIYPELIAGYEASQLTLQKLYSVPQVALFITPKFIRDADLVINSYRKLFDDTSTGVNYTVKGLLADIHKGLNLMTYNLMLAEQNMSEGMGSGMQSLMQSMKQMGQEQMAMNMLTQQLMDQLGQKSGLTQEMRSQMQRLGEEEQRLADNLRRLLETSPEAQRQASGLNQLLEELEAVSKQLKQNRLDSSLIKKQERILSRMLDAQKSINQREFSRQRKGEKRNIEDWELPPEVKEEYEQMRQKALLKDDFRNYPFEYQELIREYLRLLNLRSLEKE